MNKLAARQICALRPAILHIPVVPSPKFGIATWPAAMIVWSPGFRSTPHRHPAIQLTVATNGSLKIRGSEPGWKRGQAAVVRSNVIHAIDCRDTIVVLMYVHAQSELGAALSELLTGDIAVVPPSLVSRWRDAIGSELSRDRLDQWIAGHLLNGRSPSQLEPRLRRVLTQVRSTIGNGTSGDLSLKTLAASARLSPSRFLHVFRREMGVPLRPYIRWLRLQRAACDLLDGAALSNAAHRSGFSDAAHMSPTFRRAMGMAPRDIVRAGQLCRGYFID